MTVVAIYPGTNDRVAEGATLVDFRGNTATYLQATGRRKVYVRDHNGLERELNPQVFGLEVTDI